MHYEPFLFFLVGMFTLYCFLEVFSGFWELYRDYKEVREERHWQRVANELEVDRLLGEHKMIRSRK